MNIKNDIKNVFSSTKSLLQVNRYRTFVSLAGSDLQRKVVSSVPKSRVLVLSAHPEDATVGCVGALIKHIGQEDEVKILHLSDGSLSFPTNIRPTASEKKKMGQTRETEATEAANIIGVKDLQFWRFAQGSIQTNKTTIKLMQGILDTYKPQLIYCPFPLDDDHDRLEAAKILYEGLRLSDSRAKIYCYEVWNTIVANTILDISQQMELKVEALKNHKSQIKYKNFLEAARGLSSYRSVSLPDGKFAEAFFSLAADYYLKIFFQLHRMYRKDK